MAKILNKHRFLWDKGSFLTSTFIGLSFLVFGLLATYYANSYTVIHASNSVSDILLDNLPVVDVDLIYSEGALVFMVIIGAVLVIEPRRIPFTLKSVAIFFLVRSLFMVMTHIAPPPNAIYVQGDDIFHKISSGDDLFFSAHTGLPFLMTLIFWDDKYLRYLFLICAFIGGIGVILGHLHYSIDVFSAFFIAFGIFECSRFIFHEDYSLMGKSWRYPDLL
jgi:hypothetical protein